MVSSLCFTPLDLGFIPLFHPSLGGDLEQILIVFKVKQLKKYEKYM